MLAAAALLGSLRRASLVSPFGSSVAAGAALVALPFVSSVVELAELGELPVPTHVLWYALLLPFAGAAAEIVTAAARRRVSAVYAAAVAATAALAVAVWAAQPGPPTDESRLVPLLVAAPFAVAYAAVLWVLPSVRVPRAPAFLFALASLLQLPLGLLLGVVVALGADRHLAETQLAVAHLHYALAGGALFAFFAAVYDVNASLRPGLANLQLVLLLAGTNAMHIAVAASGYRGMPRRVADYVPEFGVPMAIAAAGAAVTAAGAVVFLVNLLVSRTTRPTPLRGRWTGSAEHGATR